MPCSCIILLHMIVYWLPAPFLLDRSCSGDVPEYLSVKQCPSVDLPGKQTPLFIPIQSHSLAPALFSCIRTTAFQLLHAAVVEPLSFAWPVIATVNRWNPLAWVGFDWALMCLLIDACCHACYCLELSQVWFIGDELECGEHVLPLRAKCVNTIW